jgi:hypothetical protein
VSGISAIVARGRAIVVKGRGMVVKGRGMVVKGRGIVLWILFLNPVTDPLYDTVRGLLIYYIKVLRSTI